MQRLIKISLIAFVVVVGGLFMYFQFPSIIGDSVYPLEYKDLIVKYSKEYAVDPNLVAAMAYVESGFNTRSVSSAGARGLMQIMPSTGASRAKALGESGYSPDKLFDPDTSIKYGASYIRSFIDRYNGNEALALYAYNAGPGNADSAARQGTTTTAVSSYSRKVLAIKDMYAKLYGNDWEAKDKGQEQPKKPTLAELIMTLLIPGKKQ